MLLLTLVLVSVLLPGCAAPPTRETLNQGYGALGQNRLDEATAAADKVLAADAAGRGAAEALYLKGMVAERRAKALETRDPPASRRYLAEARQAYTRALALKPPPKLEASIRTQLANVAYWQEDFAVAVREGLAAFGMLEKPVDKAWILYRVALSQQRQGRFTEADRTFASVQQRFPDTEPARRAPARRGATAFHVQVGAFTNPANADRMVTSLRSEGYVPMKSTDPTGKQVIAVGPVATYEQAKALQARLAGRYRDTVIVP